jgi:hypothetical protein
MLDAVDREGILEVHAELAARLVDECSLEESHVYGLDNGAVCHNDSCGGRLQDLQQTLLLKVEYRDTIPTHTLCTHTDYTPCGYGGQTWSVAPGAPDCGRGSPGLPPTR